jgi:hypothetical protein
MNSRLKTFALVSVIFELVWHFLSLTPIIDLGLKINISIMIYHSFAIGFCLSGLSAITSGKLMPVMSFVLFSYINSVVVIAQTSNQLELLKSSFLLGSGKD